MSSYSFKEIRVWNREHLNDPTNVKHLEQSWQADCGDDHAVGSSPFKAVGRLVAFLIEKRKIEIRNKERTTK